MFPSRQYTHTVVGPLMKAVDRDQRVGKPFRVIDAILKVERTD